MSHLNLEIIKLILIMNILVANNRNPIHMSLGEKVIASEAGKSSSQD